MIKFLHLWRRKTAESPSHVASTLDRLRDMREHSHWEPLTPPSTIRERADRIAEARAHIEIPPLGGERETQEHTIRYFRTSAFWRPLLYSILAFVVLLATITTFHAQRDIKSQIRQASLIYPTTAYTNLTDGVAERFARRALASTGIDQRVWHTFNRSSKDNTVVITFFHDDEPTTFVRVKVELQPGERILCTINPRYLY